MPEDQEKIIVPATADAAQKEISSGFGAAEIKITPEQQSRETSELSRAGGWGEQAERIKSGEIVPPLAGPARPLASPELRLKQVESILEEDLGEIYARLDPYTQQQFKVKGEATVRGVFQLISQAKVQVKKIIDLIRNWLKIIPGINKYFLEQEVKIKTDKILGLIDKDNQKLR